MTLLASCAKPQPDSNRITDGYFVNLTDPYRMMTINTRSKELTYRDIAKPWYQERQRYLTPLFISDKQESRYHFFRLQDYKYANSITDNTIYSHQPFYPLARDFIRWDMFTGETYAFNLEELIGQLDPNRSYHILSALDAQRLSIISSFPREEPWHFLVYNIESNTIEKELFTNTNFNVYSHHVLHYDPLYQRIFYFYGEARQLHYYDIPKAESVALPIYLLSFKNGGYYSATTNIRNHQWLFTERDLGLVRFHFQTLALKPIPLSIKVKKSDAYTPFTLVMVKPDQLLIVDQSGPPRFSSYRMRLYQVENDERATLLWQKDIIDWWFLGGDRTNPALTFYYLPQFAPPKG